MCPMYLAKFSLACFKMVRPSLSLISAILFAMPKISMPPDAAGFGFAVVFTFSRQSSVVSDKSSMSVASVLDADVYVVVVVVLVAVLAVVDVEEELEVCLSDLSVKVAVVVLVVVPL